MVNRAVPARIRRLINVESGLNDGIATPFVLVAIAGAATAEHHASTGPGAAVAELALGLLIGVVVGGGGGWLVKAARGRGWVAEGFAVGVFVFSVTTALVIGDQQKVSVIVPAAEMAAVLAALALIRNLLRYRPPLRSRVTSRSTDTPCAARRSRISELAGLQRPLQRIR
jgi:NhaP-type Na+/H+ or K+/H+ antiporter